MLLVSASACSFAPRSIVLHPREGSARGVGTHTVERGDWFREQCAWRHPRDPLREFPKSKASCTSPQCKCSVPVPV